MSATWKQRGWPGREQAAGYFKHFTSASCKEQGNAMNAAISVFTFSARAASAKRNRGFRVYV
jgi:hypothetical protein